MGVKNKESVELHDPLRELRDKVIAMFGELSPEERVAFFVGVFEVYCRDCGREHPDGRICMCSNDE